MYQYLFLISTNYHKQDIRDFPDITYLVEIYSVSAEKIISDAFSYSENV